MCSAERTTVLVLLLDLLYLLLSVILAQLLGLFLGLSISLPFISLPLTLNAKALTSKKNSCSSCPRWPG